MFKRREERQHLDQQFKSQTSDQIAENQFKSHFLRLENEVFLAFFEKNNPDVHEKLQRAFEEAEGAKKEKKPATRTRFWARKVQIKHEVDIFFRRVTCRKVTKDIVRLTQRLLTQQKTAIKFLRIEKKELGAMILSDFNRLTSFVTDFSVTDPEAVKNTPGEAVKDYLRSFTKAGTSSLQRIRMRASSGKRRSAVLREDLKQQRKLIANIKSIDYVLLKIKNEDLKKRVREKNVAMDGINQMFQTISTLDYRAKMELLGMEENLKRNKRQLARCRNLVSFASYQERKERVALEKLEQDVLRLNQIRVSKPPSFEKYFAQQVALQKILK